MKRACKSAVFSMTSMLLAGGVTPSQAVAAPSRRSSAAPAPKLTLPIARSTASETASTPETEAQPTSALPGDIIVTANKRDESINKVGLSITSVSGDRLLTAGITAPSDLGRVVPGFFFTNSIYGTPVFTILGIGFNNTALGLSPSVSVYLDEVPLPYPAMTSGVSLDLQRVEVLKGPQGVLFGNNSTGGAINYIAAPPTKDLHIGATLSVARFGLVEGEGYVSGPLSSTLGMRLAVRAEGGGAWQRSVSRPGDTLGNARKLLGRLITDWHPSDRLSLRFTASGWRDHSDTQARQVVAIIPLISGAIAGLPELAFVPPGAIAAFHQPTGNSRDADWAAGTHPRNDSWFYQLSLRGQYRLDSGVALTSVTAYSRLDPSSVVDAAGVGYPAEILTQRGRIGSFFQELRLDVPVGDRASALVGVNYSQDRIRDSLTADISGTPYTVFTGQPHGVDDQRVDTNVKTYAAFVRGEYHLTESLKATAAARYTADHRRSDLCSYDVNGAIAQTQNIFSGTSLHMGDCITAINGVPGVLHGLLNENNLSWRFGLDWQMTPVALLYGTINRGYKSGGFPNLFAFDVKQEKPVVQERLDAYEIGAKFGLFDQRARLSAALFHYDYRNKQIQGRVIVPPLGALENLVNIPKARVNGAEVQLSATPVDGLDLSIGASYTDTRIGKSTLVYTPFGTLVDSGGQRFPSTPKWQVNADVAYDKPISAALRGFGGLGLAYTGKINSAFGSLPILSVPSYTVLDARAGLGSRDNQWRLTLFVRNLTNKNYYYATIQTVDFLTRYFGRPRTFGAILALRY